ncbi:hypothetical protein [Vampirovibrio sp.]|uniref:DUF6812 domain-containing protein n=1 Tax=Vampirovibrio sp. TaxID=2717857 RepID=UPI003592FB52
MVSDLIRAVQSTSGTVQALVVTRFFNLEGRIHFPKLGKEGRRLSNMLNGTRRFIAMTDVQITHRADGVKDPKIHPFIEINVEAIEFIQPYGEDASPEDGGGSSDSSHFRVS